jgi:tRNA A-37 threonylcarbamoyl transferase component Bud32
LSTIMNVKYEQFCLTDPVFYDSPSRPEQVSEGFAAGWPVAMGWRSRRKESWTVLTPAGSTLPAQGWKIHISATVDNTVDVLRVVWNYCLARNIAFKFITNRTGFFLRNGKYADRAGSGKFITIYPHGAEELERTVRQLSALLDGSPGPYILSDARWDRGPLYLRYGAFVERTCRLPSGEFVPAITDPSGQLVPDVREPGFRMPSWAPVPDFLAPCVSARQDASPSGFPYRIERPLHYSNGGGIYLATELDGGRKVVLKEARPHAGIDPAGLDAVRRLERERAFLAKLAGTGVVPEIYGELTAWEHHFLVEEYIEGETLSQCFVARFPLIHPEVADGDVAAYTGWALDILDQVRRALRTMHGAGIVFGDLHPRNIVVRPDGWITFLDLETASHLDDRAPALLGAPGYVPPDGRTGADVDNYALASLELSLFLPLTALLPLDPSKVDLFVGSVARRFPVPKDRLAATAGVLRDRRTGAGVATPAARLAAAIDAGTPDWLALRDSMRDAILASATPGRSDRLFPGDVEAFRYGGVGLAYGAAGVLWALHRCGAGRFPEHEDWLVDAVRDNHHNGRAGFYDGLHGVAYTLAELGRRDDALAVLERALATPLDELPDDLFSGVAGVGLNLLHFAALTADSSLLERAVAAGARLADRLIGGHDTPTGPAAQRRPAGLLHGAGGQALFLVRLFEATGVGEFLDLAETALLRDLDRCLTLSDGTLQLDEGWRVMPYLATGSAGLGLVLREILRHRVSERYAEALGQIRRASEPEFVIGSGLFSGRAGLIAFLCWTGRPTSIDRHLRRLAWHIVSYRGHAAFPGDQLLRLSMDLGTGSAGVLLALSAALDERGPGLPFFTPIGGDQPWDSSSVCRSSTPGLPTPSANTA